MGKILIDTKPYGELKLYPSSEISFEPGVSILVGCNGYGKSALINQIEKYLKKSNIPHLKFDNESQGGEHGLSAAMLDGDWSTFSSAAFASEGERIVCFLNQNANKIGQLVHKNPNAEEYWILYDAVDSGLSINNIDDMKDFFNFIIEMNPKKKVYIIVSTNSYALAENARCYDCRKNKFTTFTSYNKYATFIRKTAEVKQKALDKYFGNKKPKNS